MFPLSLLQWAIFTAAAASSSVFIYRNLWPILQSSPTIRHEQAVAFMGAFIAVHSIFILAIRVTFFKHVHIPTAGK